MKSVLLTITLTLASFAASAQTTTQSGSCELQSYEGKSNNNYVFRLGQLLTYKVIIDAEGFEDLHITPKNGDTLVLGYTVAHAFPNAIGATYITGFNDIYKPPAGGFRITRRIELGEGENAGTLKVVNPSVCRGGYIGGCRGGAVALYQCK